MITRPGRLGGIVLVEPDVTADDRGFFLETYRADTYAAAGIRDTFVQGNHSRSTVGTIRGLHFQLAPGQPKLIRVARGAAYDAVVDIRPDSQTFGQWEAFDLNDENHWQLYVPTGFAHGFCAVSPIVDLVYMVGSYYDPSHERGIAWDDPSLGIPWPTADPILSVRDRKNPKLADIRDLLTDFNGSRSGL